ncbi:uncharacterized protein IL334_000294 [Kwoniella shivajii]|uniref:TRUD domain-containing protein n=1 Tax=Kwoniella shivajii TaxID=564305 RepID=A0ABZ1CPT5_9TREE|nr:hypothetical protein IL334_000294 [Kwoniella shivajii]
MSQSGPSIKRSAEEISADEEVLVKRAKLDESSSLTLEIPTTKNDSVPSPSEIVSTISNPTTTTIVTTPNSTPAPLPIITSTSTSTSISTSTSTSAAAPASSFTSDDRSGGINAHLNASHRTLPEPISKLGLKPIIPILPSSLEYIIGSKIDLTERKGFVGENECGIIGFVGVGNKGIKGVIKQRFTDFLVNEVSLDGTVLHLKDITKPKEPETEKAKTTQSNKDTTIASVPASTSTPTSTSTEEIKNGDDSSSSLPEKLQFKSHPQWPTSATLSLKSHLSDDTIVSLHDLLVEGREPPPKSDGGWGSRKVKSTETEEGALNEEGAANAIGNSTAGSGGRGQGRDRGRGRGGRGGARGGRNGNGASGGWKAEDHREVLSQPITSKDARTAAHKVLRECFGTTFESSTKEVPGEEGSRLVIKYSQAGGRSDKGQWGQPRPPKLPQYIHFTLHKSNRETMDALSHLSRMFSAHPKDLSVCGTKDKRAVTVQRVCLKRNGKTLGAVWKAANGIKQGRRNEDQAIEDRGERGVRIGDLAYSDKYLELGMLKGNQFVITLRNVQEENTAEIDKTMTSVRDHGFINFYGMQRFGTSSWPTHLTGLLILQSKWSEAIDSILSLREGEHPDSISARLAWLEDGDYNKAWQSMPRRGVAERSIWDFWRKGNSMADKMGALSSIPRNLRVMYVHAYQSYIWNLIVSERIKMSATEPLVGDLVFVDKDTLAEGDVPKPDTVPAHAKDRHGRIIRKWATTSSPEVKQLTEEDLPNHTIFDVIMPLPGWDIDYPGGVIGTKYEEALKKDGLDSRKMRREQRDFSLPGSYRRIVIRPIKLDWSHIQYTDPDLSLVQSDEDKILNLNPPVENNPQGKFRALKIELELGSATYATMVLREITREETSTWHQIGLTMSGEDKGFKGSGGGKDDEGEEKDQGKDDEVEEEVEGDIDM